MQIHLLQSAGANWRFVIIASAGMHISLSIVSFGLDHELVLGLALVAWCD